MNTQETLLNVPTLAELEAANAERVATLESWGVQQENLRPLATHLRLEIVIASLKGLRVLPKEYEYLYEAELARVLDEMLQS